MTAIKVDAKLATGANEALTPHANALFAALGSNRMAVIELRSVERAEPAPDEDKERAVKVRIALLEVANADQEETLRRALRALHLHRTAYGTLTEDQELELSKATLADTAGELSHIESARLRALIDHWTRYANQALLSSKLTEAEVRSEMRKVVDAMRDAIYGRVADLDDA